MSNSAPTLSIDVIEDLSSTSALSALLQNNQTAIFQMFDTWVADSTKTIQQTAADKPSASISLTTAPTWNLPAGITFTLTPTAKCTISVDTVSETFAVAMNIDATSTTNVSAGPTADVVYINLDLDFSIQAAASGSGTVSGVGIAGKASGSVSTTFSFCQPVDGGLPTPDAIKKAFEQLVFPLDPACATSMKVGAFAKVAFDGSINCELDVTYGLGDYKVAAPDTTAVQQALQNTVQLKAPSLEANAGVKGSITYTHTDHFAVIVNKTSDTAAVLYLVRSSENDWGANVGISVGVTTTAASVTVDQNQLQAVAQNVTGNATLAGQIATAAVQRVTPLQTTLNSKLKSWASDVTGTVGLSVALSRQKGHTALFVFDVDLTNAALAEQSWAALVGGSVTQALALKGFTLQPGSGVSDSLKKGCTLQFQFFNFFSFSTVSDYFSNGYTELGKDGTIRIHRDLGNEVTTTTRAAMQKFRIFFAATAIQNAGGQISSAVVDLCIELSEMGNSKYANALANVVGFLPGSQVVNDAQTGMIQFVAGKPSGTLDLLLTFKSSAYQKLNSSPYHGSTPPAPPQQQDRDNWVAFLGATESLAPDVNFADQMSYRLWAAYNVACIDQVGSTIPPDRRHVGNPAAGMTLLQQFPAPDLVSYFLSASQGFMNLCDDLKTLASGLNGVENSRQWQDLLNFLTQIITNDSYSDFAQPTGAALLELCSEGGAQATSTSAKSADGATLTCMMTIA